MRREVLGEGRLDAKICFVGEAPATNEIMQGRPFVGRAGEQFNNLLIHSRIVRGDCYLTNLFKIKIQKKQKPERLYSGNSLLYHKKDGFTPEGECWIDRLLEELQQGDFNVIVPLGNPATQALTEKITSAIGVTKLRGSIYWNSILECKVIPTVHPAAVMRQYLYRYYIIHDLKRIKEESQTREFTPTQGEFTTTESFMFYKAYLESILETKPDLVAFDIEVVRGEVSCISFSIDPYSAISVPFTYKGREYFNLYQEREIWDLIAQILSSPSIKKVGQNLAFDISFLFDRYGIVTKNYDDTMVAHATIYPDFPMGLDFIASTKTREPYYKDEGKQYMKWGGSDEDFLLYNAKDSLVCEIAMPELREDLKRMGNLETYEEQVALIEPTIYMGWRGMKVDQEAIEEEKKVTEEKIKTLQNELDNMIGEHINVRSYQQVANYFYVRKRLTPYKSGGKITADEGALKRIARKGYVEARTMLKIRQLKNKISKEYNVKFKDGRLVCSYKPVTKMGRLSSSEDIFGYGTNFQNRTKDFNKFLIADEGYLIYEVDLSQSDNRVVAYIAPEPRMIKAFEEGTDVHSLTASMIFNIPADEVKNMHNEGAKCDLGYGDMTHRDWGKRTNHSLNFGLGYKSFSYQMELPEKEGKFLHNKYHQVYPGVQQSYHQWVRRMLGRGRMLENPFGRKYLFQNRWNEDLFKQAYAFIPQSTTVDVINKRGLLEIYYDVENFQWVELLRQVHDSINFQIPISAGIDYHISALRKIKASLEEPIQWNTKTFSIPAEFKVGYDLYNMKELDVDNDGIENHLEEYFIKQEEK